MPFLLFLVCAVGSLGAGINYFASRLAPPIAAKVTLAITIAPVCCLWVYCAIQLWLAIETNDMKYFGADMAFAIVTIFTVVSVPASYWGARKGSFKREQAFAE